MLILNEIDEHGFYDDKKTYYRIREIVESNLEKKILFCYREEQREIGSMIRPPVFEHKGFYVVPMNQVKSRINMSNIIKEAINEKFDMVIFYRPDLNQEDAKNIEESGMGIEVILSSVRQ